MSNNNQKTQPQSSILSQLQKDKVENSLMSLDDRALVKLCMGMSVMNTIVSNYGLVGALKRKESLAKSAIADLRDGFQLVDKVFDGA
jgi:hypothetical protein